MYEILRDLPAGSLVLDLGSGAGSFPADATAAAVIRFDIEIPHPAPAMFAQGDSAHLPFRDATFNALISNHSLEHFPDLERTLQEISRVVKKNGALFIAVPDASTLTDRLYRWLGSGGGHVNAFTSAEELNRSIERATSLKPVARRKLCSSLSFLNRRMSRARIPRRALLVGGGYEWTLFLYVWLSARIDRALGTRTSVYGWALYFGEVSAPIDVTTWPNVCIRCGSGHSAGFLQEQRLVRRILGVFATYRCPSCGTSNPFSA